MTHRPNIVFIITDQMRADCLGLEGHPVVETPNLDIVGRGGVHFRAAYSSCPSCIAARASMFTGLTPSTHGRLGYQDCVPWRYDRTLAHLLSDAGYQTHCVGKTHFFPQRHHLGFQSMDSYEAGQNFDGRYVNDYHEFLREAGVDPNETAHGLDWNSWVARPSHLPEALHNNTWVAQRGVAFLRRRDPLRPFFLNLSFHRPHAPIDPPQAYWDMYRDRPVPPVPVGDWAARHAVAPQDINCWHGVVPSESLARSRRAYYAQIAHIDNQIGRVLRALRLTHGIGPTWIIFTSDHGEMLGDHHLFRKAYAYEGSARVPLLVCPPSSGTGCTSDAPVLLEDIRPTSHDSAGIPTPPSVEGRSLLPFLKGRTPDGWRSFLHGEHAACYEPVNGMQYLTDGKEKYIWYTQSGEEQFFDLRTDPAECRNLSACPAASDRIAVWRQRLVEYLATRPSDGLSDGTRLIAGTNLPHVRPQLTNPA